MRPTPSDDARRMADQINAQITFAPDSFELRNKWMAFKLSDGSTDGTLYDSKEDAVRFQLHEQMCAYFCFRNALSGVTAEECEIFLKFTRDAYDAGLRLADPDGGGPEPFLTTPSLDVYRRMMDARRHN